MCSGRGLLCPELFSLVFDFLGVSFIGVQPYQCM
jgi:hypothetical protein